MLVNNLKKSDEKCIVCIAGTANEYAPTSTLAWTNKTEYETITTREILETIDQIEYAPKIGNQLWFLSAFLVDVGFKTCKIKKVYVHIKFILKSDGVFVLYLHFFSFVLRCEFDFFNMYVHTCCFEHCFYSSVLPCMEEKVR